MAGYIKLSISFILFSLFLFGFHDLLNNNHPNKCEMTYMFEYPEYIEVKIPNAGQKQFPNYKLFAYGEGTYAQRLKKNIFRGIPVLFIPGNGGSHEQVRSLASIGYRMALDKKSPFHFNFFAINLNEDFGAVYGPVLNDETEFVAVCIRTILDLYANSPSKPSSVILVGHSLGGVIARAAVTLPEVPASFVPIIITMGSPHNRAVLISDTEMESFYDYLNGYWMMERLFDFKNIVLITIAGGRNDFYVDGSFVAYPLADIDTTTMAVPDCWLTTDHLALLWCKQLVLSINRALFDSVDPKTKQINTNATNVNAAFNYQLKERAGHKHAFRYKYPQNLQQLETKGHWSEVILRQYKKEFSRLSTDHFLMIPLMKGSSHYRHLSIIAKEIEWANWIFACEANVMRKNVKLCSTGENLSHLGRLIPGDKKEIVLDVEYLILKGHTHVVVWIQPNDNKVYVDFDMNDGRSRSTSVKAPPLAMSLSPVVVVEKTPHQALTFNLTILQLTEAWQSYDLLVEPVGCSNGSRAPIVSFNSSWDTAWKYLTSRESSFVFPLEVYNLPLVKNETDHIQVHIIFDQNCSYKISLQGKIIGVFRRMFLLYVPQFLPFVTCHLLLVLAAQMKSMAMNGYSISTFAALFDLTPIAVVPFVKLLAYFLRLVDIDSDPVLLSYYGVDFAVLPILLFLSLLPLSILFASWMWLAVLITGKTAHSFAIRVLRRTLRTGDLVTDVVFAGISKIPVAVGIAVAAFAYATCGAIGLLICTAFYFVKVFKLYEDYLEHLLWSIVPGNAENKGRKDYLSSINIHFTLLLLLCLATFPTIHTFFAWVKTNGTDQQLPSDPSLIVSLVCILSLSFIWQINHFSPNRKYYKGLGYFTHACAVATILFGSLTQYRVNYMIAAALLTTTLHQLFSPSIPEDSGDGGGSSSKAATMKVIDTEETSQNLDNIDSNEEDDLDSDSSDGSRSSE